MTRERLHRLIDRASEEDLAIVEHLLLHLLACRDPVLRSLIRAQAEEEGLTQADETAVEGGLRDVREGRTRPTAEVRRLLGL